MIAGRLSSRYSSRSTVLRILLGAGGWIALLLLSYFQPPPFDQSLDLSMPSWLLFVLFSLLVKGTGRVVPGRTYNLVSIVDIAALLIYGPLGGAWVAAGSAVLYQVAQGLFLIGASRRGGRRLSPFGLFVDTLFDSGLKTFVALSAGWFYDLLGGAFPPAMALDDLLPTPLLFLVWFVVHNLGQGLLEAVDRGRAGFILWVRTIWLPALLIELAPLPLSLLVVVVYQDLPPITFAILIGALVGTSFVIQRLVYTTRRQQQAVEELAALNEIGRATLQAELDVKQLCEFIYQQASRVVDTSTFHLGLFDGDRFTLQIWVRDGVRQDPLTVRLQPGEGIVGWMRQAKKSLLVYDFETEMEQLPAQPRYISTRPPRSAIFVPMIAGHEVIGSISIQSFEPAAFAEEQVRILSFIADQAAVAIEKARLYEEQQERAVELEQAVRENVDLLAQVAEERDRVELLYTVTRELSRLLDLDDFLRRLLQLTVGNLRADDGTILLPGTRREGPRAIALREAPRSDLRQILEQGLAGWVLRENEPALVPDIDSDARWLDVDWTAGSAISAPISRQDDVLGVVTLTHPQKDFFSLADLSLLETIGESAAVALESVRLYNAQRRRALQLETIAQVLSRILSILDLDELLTEVVELIQDRFGYSDVHIFTFEPTAEEAIYRASTDPDSAFWQERGGRISVREGLVGWVIRHGESAVVGDVQQDRRWLPDQTGVRSEVAVPLQVAGETIGVLDVQSDEVDAFDDEDLFVLQTLAGQIATALESARLYRAQQEEAWFLNVLLQVVQNISRAHDFEGLLETVVRLIPMLVGVDRCAVLMRDEEGGYIPMQAYRVGRERTQELRRWRLSPEDVPPLARVGQSRSMVALVGPTGYMSLPQELREVFGTGVVWLFPLLVREELIGVLGVGLERGKEVLSGRRQVILSGITDQVAIAIEGARLRLESIARQRLEQELNVAREIQLSLLPEEYPQVPGWSFHAAWEAARQVGGDFYDFLPFDGGRLGLVIADVSDKGVPAALFMALSRSLIRASALADLSPAAALIRANALILQDARSDMFVSVFYGVLDLETGELRYANAGHNLPLLCRHQDATLTALEAPGVVLGVVDEPWLEERVVQLRPGDQLVLYTDGVTEVIDPTEEEFGEERLRRVVQLHHDRSSEDLVQAILSAVHAFAVDQPPFDDLTLLVAKRDGPEEEA